MRTFFLLCKTLPNTALVVGHNSVLIKAQIFGWHWQHGPKHAPIMGFLLDSIADCKFAMEQTPEAGFQIMHESPTTFALASAATCCFQTYEGEKCEAKWSLIVNRPVWCLHEEKYYSSFKQIKHYTYNTEALARVLFPSRTRDISFKGI